MSTLLHIDTSARKSRSISRNLAKTFHEEWSRSNPDGNYLYQDIGTEPPPFISEAWIAAVFTEEGERTDEQRSLLAPSDQYIEEVSQADIILISTPMYNYGMPAALKAWIDQIVRVNKTFSFDLARGDYPLEPIFTDKTLVLLTSCGEFGFEEGGVRGTMNHLGPHLRTVSKYLGVSKCHEIRVEYQEFGDERHTQSLKSALGSIPELVKNIVKSQLG